MKFKIQSILWAFIGAMALSACTTTPNRGADSGNGSGTEGGSGYESENGKDGVEMIGADKQPGYGEDAVGQDIDGMNGEGMPPALGNTFEPRIYFDYDQYTLDDDDLNVVKHYADIMIENPEERIRLVGHTDERGTPEYNLALGEKRARAVEEAFMLYGVTQDRMEVITLGEEQPMVEGHTEDAWSKNRRVEIVVK